MLSYSQDHRYTRSRSEPPPITQVELFTMPPDPSGRYLGSNWDPLYFQKKDRARAGGPPVFSSDSNSAIASGNARNKQNGYTNHYGSNAPTSAPIYPSRLAETPKTTQAPSSRSDHDYSYNGRKSPRSPSPTKRYTGSTPTGPASMQNIGLPAKPSLWALHSMRTSGNGELTMNTSSGSSEYNTAIERTSNEEGHNATQSTSSPSLKVHPSRLGLVPQPQTSPVTSSPLNPHRTPASAGTATPSRDGSLGRGPRPASLNLTPVGTPNEQVKTPATANWTPSLLSSPANKSPLDSLDKLRRFKEQVAASRKSGNNMSGMEMSKLAQVAETFLKSQDIEASEKAFAELQRLTGQTETETAAQAAPPLTPAPSIPPAPAPASAPASTASERGNTTPIENIESAVSRAAMLKERLLASKRSGSSPSTQDGQRRQVDADASGTNGNSAIGAKRERSDNERHDENDEQKRYRAAVWAHQKPAEPHKKSQHDTATVQQGREREEGEWEDARISIPSHGHDMERKLSLQDRISERPRHGSTSHRRYSPSPDRSPDRYRRDDRYGSNGPLATVAAPRRDEPQSGPIPRGPSGYEYFQGRNPSRHDYTQPRPSDDDKYRAAPSGSGSAQGYGPSLPSKREAEIDEAYEARRRARLASLHSPPVKTEPSRYHQPSPHKPERTYARAVADSRDRDRDSRYPRDDHYARQAEHVRPHEQPAPAPAPVPAPVPVQPLIDPATVLATLDVLKAQIASLEKLLPAALPAIAFAAPTAPARTYAHETEGYHAHPPLPPPSPPPHWPIPPPPHHMHPPPPRESHHRITSEVESHRAGPYKSEGGRYKGRDEYHDRRTSEHGHGHDRGHGHGHGPPVRGHGRGGARGGAGVGGRGRGGGSARRGGSSRGDGRGRGGSRGRR